MKHLIIALVNFLFVFNTFGQVSPTVTPVIDQFGFIQSMTSKTNLPETKGSYYLNEGWITSVIHLKPGVFGSDKIEGIPIKVDLRTNTIELNTQYGIKVLSHSKVDKFEWINPSNNTREIYSNCNQFDFNGNNLDCFCMVYGDDAMLVKHTYIDFIKADFNVALNVGNKEDRIIKKSKLYLAKGNQLMPCNKKSLYALLSDKEVMMKEFVNRNRVDFNEELDLRSVIDYYNSL